MSSKSKNLKKKKNSSLRRHKLRIRKMTSTIGKIWLRSSKESSRVQFRIKRINAKSLKTRGNVLMSALETYKSTCLSINKYLKNSCHSQTSLLSRISLLSTMKLELWPFRHSFSTIRSWLFPRHLRNTRSMTSGKRSAKATRWSSFNNPYLISVTNRISWISLKAKVTYSARITRNPPLHLSSKIEEFSNTSTIMTKNTKKKTSTSNSLVRHSSGELISSFVKTAIAPTNVLPLPPRSLAPRQVSIYLSRTWSHFVKGQKPGTKTDFERSGTSWANYQKVMSNQY